MKLYSFQYGLVVGLSLGSITLLSGCGGGSGSEAVATTRLAPTAKTVVAVDNLLGGYGQARVTSDVQSKGQATRATQASRITRTVVNGFDSLYSLYFTVDDSPADSVYRYNYFEDAALNIPAGQSTQSYGTSQGVFGLITSVSLTKGPLAGLTGSSNAFKSGTVSNYDSEITTPNVGKTVSTFRGAVDTGGILGTGSHVFTSVSGYRSQATFSYKIDGSKQYTTSDSNNYASNFNFAADASGQGTITGTDPGLPASAVWDTKGTGTVTWADGSKTNFTQWDIPTNPT
jgi:hypothetical protein